MDGESMLSIPPEPWLRITLTITQLLMSIALLPLSLKFFPLRPPQAIHRGLSHFAIFLFLNLTLITLSDVIKSARLARSDLGGVDDVVDTWLDTAAMCGQLLLTGVRFGGFRYVVWISDVWERRQTSRPRTRTFTFYWNIVTRVLMTLTIVIFVATGALWTMAKISTSQEYMGVEAEVWMGLFGGWYVIVGSLILGVTLVGIIRNQRYMVLRGEPSKSNVGNPKEAPGLVAVPSKAYQKLKWSLSTSTILTLLGLIIYLVIDGEISVMLASMTFRLHQFGLLIYMNGIRDFVKEGHGSEAFLTNA